MSQATYRRPKPNEKFRGSVSGGEPSVDIKRSGLNSIGLWYILGSWVSFLFYGFRIFGENRSEDITYQIFGMIKDPLGMK
jgi:hypothetical protein